MKILFLFGLGVAVSGCQHSPVNEALSKVSDVPISKLEADQASGMHRGTKTLSGRTQPASQYAEPAVPASEVFGSIEGMIQEYKNPSDGEYTVFWDSTNMEDPPNPGFGSNWFVSFSRSKKALVLNVSSSGQGHESIETTYANVTPEMIARLAKQVSCSFDDLISSGNVVKSRKINGKPQ